MDLDDLDLYLVYARYKNFGVTRELGHLVYGGPGLGTYEDYWSGPKMEFMGEKFAPFSHNYLYGWNVKNLLQVAFRAMKEDQGTRQAIIEELRKMDEVVGGHDETEHFLDYVFNHGGIHYMLLYQAFHFSELQFNEIVYLLNQWFGIQARSLQEGNDMTMWLAPALVVGQLYALGWKRTLWVWLAGALITEGAFSLIGSPFSGWSIITYMAYGQAWNETFSDRKLRTLSGGVQNLRGLAINGIGGFGGYNFLSNLYYDPAPFLQKSQKTNIHHGAHHLGLIAGFLLNRWTR